MATTTARPDTFVPGRDYPSPVTHVVGFGYYDGATDGILKTADGSVFRFEMTEDDIDPAGPNRRTFDLSVLPAEVFERVVALLAPYQAPGWPVWVPHWSFPTDEVRARIDAQIDRWLATAGRPVWRVGTESLTGSVSVRAAG